MQKRENRLVEEWTMFREIYKGLPYILGIVIFMTCGIRVIGENFFLDSEIMILNPDYMHYTVWLGSNRFGLAFTSWLFGLDRLVPWISGGLMALTMWASGIALAFCTYRWTGHDLKYHYFICFFSALFISAPIFAEQFLFILQSFEIAFAILLCILAAGLADWIVCADSLKRKGKWISIIVIGIIWSVGSYQSMAPLYLALIFCAFVLRYESGNMNRTVQYGLRQAVIFGLAMIVYGVTVVVIRHWFKTESTYISSMIHWTTDSFRTCLSYIKHDVMQVLLGKNHIYYSEYYTPVMITFVLRSMYRGWKKKTGVVDYIFFLFGGGCLVISPFFLTVLTGYMQTARSQLVYPLTYALFFASLTIFPSIEGISKITYKTRKRIVSVLTVIVFFMGVHQVNMTAQLFQTANEAYRNDVLTANRMYSDICQFAQKEDLSETLVIFTGKRDAGLSGPVVRGELSGLSFFEAEAHAPAGISGRVGSLFLTLGLDMRVLGTERADLYQEAVDYMQEAPSWPLDGSIRWMNEIIVVKLSNE